MEWIQNNEFKLNEIRKNGYKTNAHCLLRLCLSRTTDGICIIRGCLSKFCFKNY